MWPDFLYAHLTPQHCFIKDTILHTQALNAGAGHVLCGMLQYEDNTGVIYIILPCPIHV